MEKRSFLSVVFAVVMLMVVAGCDDKAKKPGSDTPAASAMASASAMAAAPAMGSPAMGSASAMGMASAMGAASAAMAPVPDSIAAQHVLVAYKGADKAPKGVTRTKADAKKRAEEVAAKAKSGADFSALVAEYSDDPAAKERQGSVGKFTREKMAKPFSDAAFALGVNETSGAVETPFGFHVIKRNQ